MEAQRGSQDLGHSARAQRGPTSQHQGRCSSSPSSTRGGGSGRRRHDKQVQVPRASPSGVARRGR
ncbi:unnamed protein product [Ectocarpus sp. 6 AP-2014]